MSKVPFSIRIDQQLKEDAKVVATRMGISLAQLVALQLQAAVTDRTLFLETLGKEVISLKESEALFNERLKVMQREQALTTLREYLKNVPPPDY
jgi:antitoxin component of RelBE/YafQ-DinJ toxin-antitoxin module